MRGELEGRLDANFYGLLLNTVLVHDKPLTSIGSNFYVRDGDHNKFPPEHLSDSESGVRYLRAQDIKEGNIIDEDPIFVSKEYFKSIQRSHILKGSVLFSIMASVGSIAVYERNEPATANRAVGILVPKPNCVIIPKFLECFFNTTFGTNLITSLKKGGIQQRINLADFGNIKIPKLSTDEQRRVIAFYEAAYASKRAKESEAARLLASIDGYLLEQLGITLPEVTERKKTFFVCSDKVSGGRFDPKLYLPSTRGLIDCLFSTKYQYKRLKHLITHSVSGDWGIENFEEGFDECLVIRATEFDNRYNLRLENSRVKYRFIAKTKLQKLDTQPNDLLIEKSGGSTDQPVGRIAILNKELTQEHKLAFSNFVHKIRLSNDVNSDFAYYYLNTLHSVKITDVMQSQTNGIRNLIMKEYFNIPIPLPTIETQTEIATTITEIRTKAQGLEAEAQAAVEAAKKEVEAMILGEEMA